MFTLVRRFAAAAVVFVVGASTVSATTMWEAEAPAGAFSSNWAAPTQIGAGVSSIHGTGAGGVSDNFVFTALPGGAQTLQLVFTAPAAVDQTYSAGGAILWSDQPFRWGWHGQPLFSLQLDELAPKRTATLALPDTFAGTLYLALNFTHGANIAYEITAPSNAAPALMFPDLPLLIGNADAAPSPVPVPAAAALLASGLAGLGALRLRRRG